MARYLSAVPGFRRPRASVTVNDPVGDRYVSSQAWPGAENPRLPAKPVVCHSVL
jgi:hypothetical protein